jgi:hypothetical protein
MALPNDPPNNASKIDSTNTEITTGIGLNPSALSVAISTERVETAEYMVLSAPKIAPIPIMAATE